MAKTLVGIVSSDKPDKSIVVTVQTRKTHPLYKKQYLVSKRYMAHDEKNEAAVGDRVAITECKPLSVRKHYRLTNVIERPLIREDRSVDVITKEDNEEQQVKSVKTKVKKPVQASKIPTTPEGKA